MICTFRNARVILAVTIVVVVVVGDRCRRVFLAIARAFCFTLTQTFDCVCLCVYMYYCDAAAATFHGVYTKLIRYARWRVESDTKTIACEPNFP